MKDKRTFARNWRWILLSTVMEYVAFDCLNIAIIGGRFISVPDERDPRLIGRWVGTWRLSDLSGQRSVEFDADGTWWSHIEPKPTERRFLPTWGTNNGSLHVKWLATDYWTGKSSPYALSDDGQTLTLTRGDRFPSYLLPSTLHRFRYSRKR